MNLEEAVEVASTAHKDTVKGDVVLEFDEPRTATIDGKEHSGKFATVSASEERVIALFGELVDRNDSHVEMDEVSVRAVVDALGDR